MSYRHAPVAGQVGQKVVTRILEFLSVKPQSHQPYPKRELLVIRMRLAHNGAALGDGLGGHGEAQIYICSHTPGVQRRVKHAEFNSAPVEYRVQIECKIPAFERAGGVVCAFSTRIGGVSPPPFDTLNFSRKREPNEANFQENMRRFADAVGFDSHRAVLDNYEHGVALYHAKGEDAGRGVVREALPVFCDGLLTDETELPLVSLHADCVPLFFYDPVRRAVAVCHAGWRGVSGHMVLRMVEALCGMGCRPENILGAVGPCISVRCYEVGEEVRDIFIHEFGSESVQEREGRIYADLAAACVIDMRRAGVAAANITVSDLCTYENSYLFYSHRRDKGQTGAMAAVILLRGPQQAEGFLG